MEFLLVNGYIQFPAYRTANGNLLLQLPEGEEVRRRLQLTPVSPPSKDILAAVNGQYFDTYPPAAAYLAELVEIENA